MVGWAMAATGAANDGTSFVGLKIGHDVVGTLIDGSDLCGIRWMLGTADAHTFYAQFGFGRPSDRLLERPPAAGDPKLPSNLCR